MDTSREKAGGLEGGASIRLHYSTQLQIGGRTHTIDAEISIPVGASQEMREQIICETEMGIEQLARQIHQRGTRSAETSRPQAPLRSTPNAPAAPLTSPVASRPEGTVRPQSEPVGRQTSAPSPATRTPIGESMPATPAASGEGNPIRLPQFLSAINKYLNISPTDAMRLLKVDSLDGLNYRDAYRQLQALIEQKNAETGEFNSPPGSGRSAPLVEAPRQMSKTTSLPTAPRQSTNQARISTQTQGQASLKEAARTAPQTAPPISDIAPESRQRREPEPGKDFAGSPKAPIPIHIGIEVVHEAPTQPYKFDEEEGEEFEEDEEEGEEDYGLPANREQERASAQLKLDRLKSIRGSQAASAERLKVLDTLVDLQISEEQLQKIIQVAWGATNKKKLKNAQVEELISWAKEDYFVEEAEAMLALIEGEE